MDIARRFNENPILKPHDISSSSMGMNIEGLLNPGVFRFENKIWLLLRVAERPCQEEGQVSLPIHRDNEEIEILRFNKNDPNLVFADPRVISYGGIEYLTTLSHLRLVCSEGGRIFQEPAQYKPIFGKGPLESFGIEDCRVTEMDETFNLTYTMVSPAGVGVGLIQTRDWKNFDRKGMIFPPHNKDCAIFTEKINNKYFALHRPSSPELGGNYIWIAESHDLLHWGNHRCIATTRSLKWDSKRIGAGASPIKTPEGWLQIYHGADGNNRYCLGALLLDLQDPSQVIARSEEPIMEPIADCEINGFFGNVIFTNGHLVQGDIITIYYGASDQFICGAEFSIREILQLLRLR
ncbi:MAG TPA: glycoside hydrolase family 130 protein [Cyclobacteriaceae bacterium]